MKIFNVFTSYNKFIIINKYKTIIINVTILKFIKNLILKALHIIFCNELIIESMI